jgi:hypothetical protein
LEIKIDTYPKYLIIILYILINNIIRELYDAIINPFLINEIQTFKQTEIVSKKFIFYIMSVSTIYKWIDWFVSLQMIFSQIDLLILETFFDWIYSILTTNFHFQHKQNNSQQNNNIANSILLE